MATVPVQVREAIVRAVEEQGLTYQATADLLDVGYATVNRVLSRYRKTKSVEPLPKGGGWASPIQGQIADLLTKIVTTMSDATVEELTAALQKRARITTSRSAVQRALHRLGFSRKKSHSWRRSATRPNGEHSVEHSARGSRR
jgi:transposase